MANKPDDPQRPDHDQSKQRPADSPEKTSPKPAEEMDSDSAIDFGVLNSEEMSGISVIDWASLVENPAPVGGDSQPRFDSPSDKEILLNEESQPAPEELPVQAEAPADHTELIDLEEVVDLAEQEAAPEEDAVFNFGEEPIELAEEAVATDEVAAHEEAVIDLTEEVVDLGDEALIVEDSADQPDATIENSSVNLGDEAAPAKSGESFVNIFGDDVLIEQGGSSSALSGSSRDLIAEGLESGVDLMRSKKETSSEADDSIEDDFFKQLQSTEESSSVDLGSMHSIPVFDIEQSSREASAVNLDENLASVEPEIDFNTIPDSPSEEAPALPVRSKKAKPPIEEEEGALDPDDITPIVQDTPTAKKSKTSRDDSPEEEPLEEKPKKGKKKTPVPDDEDAPAPRPRSRVGAFVGGGTLGFLAGAAALAGAWVGGVIPPELAGIQKPATPPTLGVTPPVPVVTFEKTLDQIRSGQLDKVTPEDLDRAEEARPEQLVARAEYLWLNYLRNERGTNPLAKLAPTADPVKKALTDLEKAIAAQDADVAADALFLRAQIHELTENLPAAKADYDAGIKRFAASPLQKQRFETALQVMDLTRKVSRLTPPGLTPRHLALLLIAFQPPPGQPQPQPPMPPAGQPQPQPPVPPAGGAPGAPTPPTAPPLPPEAGLSFWAAIREARAGKLIDAVKLLDEARTRHDQRRYLLPRKPLNPLSDPSERIFLQTCDALKEYWSLLARLNNPGYLDAEMKDRIPQIEALLTRSAENVRATMLKDVATRLVKDKPVASVDDLVKLIDGERKTAADAITALEKTAADQKTELGKLGDKLKDTSTTLTKTQQTLTATQTDLKTAQAAGDAALATLKEVGSTIGSDFKDLKTSRDPLLKEVKDTVRIARMVDPKGTIRQLERDLAADRARLAQRWEPAQMLTHWLSILDADRERKEFADGALADVRRVLADPKATDEDRARATLIQGLILRNAEKYPDALPLLEKAQDALARSPEALERCTRAIEEAKNPAAAYVRNARDLVARNQRAAAVALLERGLKVLPEPRALLHLERAQMALDAALTRGALEESDPLVAEVRKDAAAAAQGGLAEGSYLLGRLEENLGRLAEAEKFYRAALKAHDKADADGSRYRIALARVLLRLRPANAAPRLLPSPTRTGRAAPPKLDPVAIVLLLALQAPPGEKVAPAEAEKLADEILALGDAAPFEARAQALAIKGLHTRALNVYLEGLRAKARLAPEDSNRLLDLVNGHPALRRPQGKSTPDPLLSEKHYGAGLNFFFARRYPDAEKEFLSAIENDNADARYFYFLGLSRLAQNKREAIEDFDQGARLEALGRPDRASVSQALERIQGPMRTLLNEVRSRPVRESAR